MLLDRTSQTIAHFIGYFDMAIEEARLRIRQTEGAVAIEKDRPVPDFEALAPGFASDFDLKGYIPDVPYRGVAYGFYGGSHFHGSHMSLSFKWQPLELADLDLPSLRLPLPVIEMPTPELFIFAGPGSAHTHMTQVNLLFDNDYVNMTGEPHPLVSTAFVHERMLEYVDEASVYTDRTTFLRTDSYETFGRMANYLHMLEDDLAREGRPPIHEGADSEFVATGGDVAGIHVNGELREAVPLLEDFLPDRGLAAPPEDPDEDEEETERTENAPSADNLVIDAGANVVANVAALTSVGIVAPVMSVMGNYHQVDVIAQATIYSDVDDDNRDVDGVAEGHGGATTQAFNIASFQEMLFDAGGDEAGDGGAPVFPTDWIVSRIDGDVCFMQWIEQYNFVTDNDQLVVTSTGSDVTILTGGNTAINVSAFFGMSMYYDLVIIGGDVYDMNVINQLAVLYDNDWLVREGETPSGTTFDSSGNLLWNQASITNVGAGDRFEAMPDYMQTVVQAIDDRDVDMPKGLASDSLFEGQETLSVLYITGNFYKLTYVSQVNVLGDADHVSQVAADYLAENDDASVTIRTGSNAVVNIAEIVDYDAFGSTTYLGGGLYTDAILIQGGLIEEDDTQPQPVETRLANEVIAFLDDAGEDNPDAADGGITSGHDYSWNTAMPSDAMQTVVA